MTVQKTIDELNRVEDKHLPVKLLVWDVFDGCYKYGTLDKVELQDYNCVELSEVVLF